MEDLFRFVQIRSAYRDVTEVDALDLAAPTAFQQAAASVVGPIDSMLQRRDLAQNFAATAQFVTGERRGDLVDTMSMVSAVLQAAVAAAGAQYSRGALAATVDQQLGRTAAAFLGDPKTRAGLLDVKDSIIAVKLVPTEHRRPIHRLVEALRVHAFIERFDADPGFAATQDDLAPYLRRPVALPAWVTDRRARVVPPRTGDKLVAALKPLVDRHTRLDKAISELRAIRPAGYRTTAQQASPGHLPPKNLRPAALFRQEMTIRQQALSSSLLSAGSTVSQPGSDLAKLSGGLPGILFASSHLGLDQLTRRPPEVSPSRAARIALSGRPGFSPRAQLDGLRLDAAVAKGLSADTQAVLKELKLDSEDPVHRTLMAMSAERRRVHEAAQGLVQPRLRRQAVRRRGNYVVSRPSRWLAEFSKADPKTLLDLVEGLVPAPTPAVPLTRADIRPVGVMELMLVRQQLKGYERSELAHVENVLKSEVRERTHRRRSEIETTFTLETEREVDTETLLDTTDRFEMRREAQTALQEQTDVKGSLTVSGRYGSSVEFQASGEASWSRRAEAGTQSASEMAREVTRRASERVSDRVLRRETRRTMLQVEDFDRHAFDNARGKTNIVGVYQWLSKVYEAQVFNYGQRVLYDLTVPEPGALLLESFHRNRTEAVEITEPPAFDVLPSELMADTYQDFVVLYGATGVKPPPEPFVTESYDFNTGGEDKDQEFTNSTRVQIPDGYAAFEASVGIAVTVWDDWSTDVVMGDRFHRFDGSTGWVWTTGLDGQTGAIPFALTTDQVGDIAVAVEVRCEATDRATRLWQAEAHSQLTDAYRARHSEYEAKLSALEADAPAEVVSRSSYRNRDLIVDELKRLTVSILSEQHFDLFNAVDAAALGLPQVDFEQARAEGAYARFFEQAFEWENVAWATYSYFWGRKTTWLERLAIQDGDVDFEDFLKAGAVRVVIPVRPGFEAAVDHFRLFGVPWLGGALPTVSDDEYLPIADEIAARLGRPGDEHPQGDSWEVRVPTDLVMLRLAADLPAWQKQPNGDWTPAN